jgi:hypothetical protein
MLKPQIGRKPTVRLGTGLLLIATLSTLVGVGCARHNYRQRADREASYLIREKTEATPWTPPMNYTIQPDPRSRFYDPTNPDCPLLPPAGPNLYQYKLPDVGSRERRDLETLPTTPPNNLPALPVPALDGSSSDDPSVVPVGHAVEADATSPSSDVRLILFQEQGGRDDAPATPMERDPFSDRVMTIEESLASFGELEIQPIEPSYWEEIPPACLARMLEFASIDQEYRDAYGRPPSPDLLDDAPRLTLRDIFELALLNSREYQTQKEQLYRAALALSLERYAYATKFTVGGNGVDPSYSHRRIGGTTVNTLGVPSQLQGDRLLATGGTILGRFANDVILTFNGPTGFAADISSEMLFNVTQTVFQRDIILNSLIQSERDLVYAARSFARYRKQFFYDVASEYYGLLASYRGIEIDAQNYFANVRTYQQNLEESQSGIARPPNPVSVNQFEQGVLRGLSSLIQSCNRLEESLDRLKLTIGLPTETPINITLDELDRLTLRDSIEVERERARRWNDRLQTFRSRVGVLTEARAGLEQQMAQLQEQLDNADGLEASTAVEARIKTLQSDLDANTDEINANHADVLNAAYSVAEHVILWSDLREQMGQARLDVSELQSTRALFRMNGARLDSFDKREDLLDVANAVPPAPRILVFQRQLDMIESQLALVQALGQFAFDAGIPDDVLNAKRQAYLELDTEGTRLRKNLADGLKTPEKLNITKMLDDATLTLAKLDELASEMDRLLFGDVVEAVDLATTLAETESLLSRVRELFEAAGEGLVAVDISADDAMVTALVQRLDLMNERWGLADQWRQIKLAADDLRSVLNLNATQRIGTENNRPFDFTLDNSQTQLGISFDLPLNRKAQRNTYRRSLISYNQSWRGLIGFEDQIKFDIRRQLRDLAQARVQYPIAVASAALSEEQVLNTRLQLVLGLEGVRALDVLEALRDSREALSAVANARINYIVQRARLALDLEVMMLDDTGFWPEVYDENYQPRMNGTYPANAGSAYGDFPCFLKVSPELKRMLHYAPPGDPAALFPAEETEAAPVVDGGDLWDEP